ncbi:hypothetical protein [Paraburkholderia mimosarum]|nr:hypothetical protein [Paraburkholderia mimosarum]
MNDQNHEKLFLVAAFAALAAIQRAFAQVTMAAEFVWLRRLDCAQRG